MPTQPSTAVRNKQRLVRWSYLALVASLGLAVMSVLVTRMRAAWACLDMVACRNGDLLPPDTLGQINMLHRVMLVLSVGLLWFTTRRIWRSGQPGLVRIVAVVASALVGLQLVLGTTLVLTLSMDWFGLVHQLLGVVVALSSMLLVVVLQRHGQAFETPKRIASEPTPTRATINDFVALTKPRIISLLLLITLATMLLASGQRADGSVYQVSWGLILWTLIGGYLAAGGANAINMYLDRDVDALMGRTSRRPLPSSRVLPEHALVFGIVLNVLAFALLAWSSNVLTGAIAVSGSIYYVLIYTRLLKRSTYHNIIIGGAAGAVPPLVGWAAVRGEVGLFPVILFAIIFYWTPPHFWALALLRRSDYARAGIPMLPVAKGEAETKWQIVLYSGLLVAISIIPSPLRMTGPVYLLLALLLGLRFLYFAFKLFREPGTSMAWPLYKYSLLYLALLFGALVVDHFLMRALA